MTQNVQVSPESAILVGIITPDTTRWVVDDALAELEMLAATAGADVTDRMTQHLPNINVSTYIGKGKVADLRKLVAERKSDVVIFDDDLSPVQLRNLERELKCKLVDRSGLILDIFARNAKTAVAKTQVELAQLDYMMTRLTRQWTHLSRQSGGIGTKGPGETQIETDRRLIGNRMAVLKDRLERIDRQRTTQRKGREQKIRVSLVGYTNAGKSTLMNSLADTSVLAENRLFATLDTTTRSLYLANSQEILLSDTVGFIRKLPHKLIESFKSTLDEVRESDILLHVVDVHHPGFEDQVRVVNQTLIELGIADKPSIIVFNKVDMLEDRSMLVSLRREYPSAVFVSGLRSIGLDTLKDAISRLVEKDYIQHHAYIPVTEARTIAYIHRVGRVLSEKYLTAREEMTAEESEIPVVSLLFRVPSRYSADLTASLGRFKNIKPLSTSEGDGFAGEASGMYLR